MKFFTFCAGVLLAMSASAAPGPASEFVGTYVAKEADGAEVPIVSIVREGDKLVAYEIPADRGFEVRMASGAEAKRISSDLASIPTLRLSGIKAVKGDESRVILVRVPIGTVLDKTRSTTGYFLLGMGAVEVHKR